MTDPRSALERLTRWRDSGASTGVFVSAESARHAFAADVLTLLSTVEQMREALKNLNDIREGDGGTLMVHPETGWPLAWGECPVATKEDKP